MATQRPGSEKKSETAVEKAQGEGGMQRSRREVRRGALARALSPFDVLSSSPFQLMRRLSDDMDRMFNDLSFAPGFGAGLAMPALPEAALFYPQIEVRERGDEITVRADLPGIKKEDLNIEVVGNSLVLSGERRFEDEREEPGYYRSERQYGSFQRVIPFAEGADLENASASFKDGVLAIKVKQPKRQGRRIEIEGGEKEVKQVPAEAKEIH